MAQKRKRPKLYATLGFPGSGKTYFSERFAKEFGIFHLNSDRLRLELIDKPKYTGAEHAKVFGVMDYLAEHLLQAGVSVVYDANTTKRLYRRRLRAIARKSKADYLLIYIKTPVVLAEARLSARKKIKSKAKQRYYRPTEKEILHLIRKEIEEPLASEPHVILDGTKAYNQQKKILEAKLL